MYLLRIPSVLLYTSVGVGFGIISLDKEVGKKQNASSCSWQSDVPLPFFVSQRKVVDVTLNVIIRIALLYHFILYYVHVPCSNRLRVV